MGNPLNWADRMGSVWQWLTAATILVVFVGLRAAFQAFRIGLTDRKERNRQCRERAALRAADARDAARYRRLRQFWIEVYKVDGRGRPGEKIGASSGGACADELDGIADALPTCCAQQPLRIPG